jgi:hypothetical protein
MGIYPRARTTLHLSHLVIDRFMTVGKRIRVSQLFSTIATATSAVSRRIEENTKRPPAEDAGGPMQDSNRISGWPLSVPD